MPTAPYDNLEACVTTARVRLNDAIQSVGGSVLTDNASFTPYIINAAWRWLQEYLVSRGMTVLIKEVSIGVPAIVNSSPAAQVWVDWTGYFDGSTFHASSVICLPQDLIQAKDCWENTGNGYQQMDEFKNGLPRIAKNWWLGSWEWRDNKLYFVGATNQVQPAIIVLVRYASYFADFVEAGTTPYASQTVPIMRALDSFAWRIAFEMSSARGDTDTQSLASNAEAAADRIFSRDTEVQTGIQQTSEYQKMKDPNYEPVTNA